MENLYDDWWVSRIRIIDFFPNTADNQNARVDEILVKKSVVSIRSI